MKNSIRLIICLSFFMLTSTSHAGIWTMYVGGAKVTTSPAIDIANDAIVMTFEDGFAAETIRLTIDFQYPSEGVDSAAFLSDIAFNVDPAIGGLTFDHISGVQTRIDPTSGNNTERISPEPGFDILFDYPPPTGGQKFYAGMSSTYDISGVGLDLTSFDYFNNNGDFKAYVHINAVHNGHSGKYGDTSVDNTEDPHPIPTPGDVPEPTTLTIWCTLLAGLSFFRRRKLIPVYSSAS